MKFSQIDNNINKIMLNKIKLLLRHISIMAPYFDFLNFFQLWRAIISENIIFIKNSGIMLNNFLLAFRI